MGMEKITSTANPQVRQLIQLQKKARLRKEEDVFTVEGIKMYQEVPMDACAQLRVRELFPETAGAVSWKRKDDDLALRPGI